MIIPILARVDGSDGPDINIAAGMMRTVWTLYAITLVVVVLRLYTQWRVTCSLGLGDAMMALSILCGTGFLIALTIQHHYGLGRHFSYLNPHQKIEAVFWSFVTQPLGIMAPAFGRNASCVLMLQLFGITKRRKYILWATFWQSLVVNVLTIILIFAQCKDARTMWDPIGHPSHCWSPKVQEYTGFVQGAINSATDLFLTILPIRIFYTLKMSLPLKLGLGFLLGLSIFGFAASMVKTVELRAIGERGDFTFGTVDFFTWVAVETALVDIAASAPLVLPLLRKFRKVPPATESHQLRKTGHSIRGRTPSHPLTRDKSKSKVLITALDTELHNSSEENMLNTVDAPEQREREQNTQKMDRGDDDGKGLESDTSTIFDGRFRILKHTSFDVSYKVNDTAGVNPDGTTKRDEMWMTKELPKIPWEAHVDRNTY